MLNGMVSLPANLAPASGWPMLITYTNLLQSLLIIPLIFILVSLYESIGAAISSVIMNSTYILFMVPYFFNKILKTERKRWYFNDIMIPLFVSFSISFCCKVFMPYTNSTLILILWLSIIFFASFASIIIFFFIKKNEISTDIRIVFFKIISKFK
jgi:hypothetical protein